MAGMKPPITQYLEALLTRAGEVLDPVDLAIIAPGAEVAWDNCCGQLWVRVMGYVPATGRGGQVKKADGTLCAPRRIAEVEIGVLRCAAMVDDQGRPPTEKELSDDGAMVLKDAEALWAMLSCEVAIREVIRWEPLGPEGGCVGGAWQFSTDID